MNPAAERSASFASASWPRSLGDGTFTATLRSEWAIDGHPHSGFLIALMTRAAALVIPDHGELGVEPISVSAEFLRAPSVGPALLRTDVRKAGTRTTVIAVGLEQRGRSCTEARVVMGRLPTQRPLWSELPVMAAEPPNNAVVLGEQAGAGLCWLAADCDVRLDASTAFFVSRRRPHAPAGPGDRTPGMQLRLWARPRSTDTDLYFALLAGDIAPPVPHNLGRTGRAPVVQHTALLRARPAPGWLRVHVATRAVHGHWYDSDATVLDATGQLISQARQLAVTPGP